MFELNQAIASWRRQLTTAGIRSNAVLDELESHLREDIEQRVRSGSDAQQAFEAAVAQMGEVRMLRSEFAKTGAAVPSHTWTLVRIGCVMTAVFILSVNAWALVQLDLNPIQFLVAAATALFLGSLPFQRALLLAMHSGRAAAFLKGLSPLVAAWPIVAIFSTVHPLHLAFSLEVFIWNLFAMCAFTLAVFHFYRLHHDPSNVFAIAPWSPTARQTLQLARVEASGLYHDYIGTEHLLLGLLQSEPGIVPGILKKLGVDQAAIRSEIRKLATEGPAHQVPAEIPLTPRARTALCLAAEQAKSRNRSVPGPEHIFLGLLLEGHGVAALVLKNLGVRIEKAREIIENE